MLLWGAVTAYNTYWEEPVLKHVVVCVLALLPLSAMADRISPSHYCTKPFKPYQFNSRMELNRFLDDTDKYKQCIAEFVAEQREAAQKHQRAAKEAIDEWNTFVNLELR